MDLPNSAQANILIVDDSPANLRLLALMLSTHGHRVRIAEDGPRALESVRASQPDLIMLDVMMPQMNGFEVCMQLRADPATRYIPIIFISALDDTQAKVNAFTAGGVDYVSKPFQVEEVLARVETHLAVGELRKRLQAANDALAKANAELEQRVAEHTAKVVALNSADQRFVPLELLELLRKPSIGEVQLGDHVQRDMTILCLALQSFAARTEHLTTKSMFDLVNSYLGKVVPVIRQQHGVVDKYQDAGLRALFADNGVEALKAAVTIQRMVVDYNQQLEHDKAAPIAVGIGVHTGLVRLGVIGDDHQLQGTVISEAANVAARLEALCEVYGARIIASGPTLERLPDPAGYQYRFLDRVQVRGEEMPVAVYEIFDAEDPAAVELKNKTRDEFEQGVLLYYSGDLDQACNHMNRVLEQNPNDQAAKCYLRRTVHAMEDSIG